MNEGFCWLCHHNKLVEWCYDIQGRIGYIKERKPIHEQEIRLTWFQPVKGKLLDAVVEAREIYDKARKAHYKAWVVYNKARKAYGKVWVAYCKTGKAYYKTQKAYDKTLADHKEEIEVLHVKEQPDCPWNGERLILPKALGGE